MKGWQRHLTQLAQFSSHLTNFWHKNNFWAFILACSISHHSPPSLIWMELGCIKKKEMKEIINIIISIIT